jgi:hypothetical protein
MARALVYHERQGVDWRAVGVFLGTTRRLDSKMLPGDARRDAWAASLPVNTKPPFVDGIGLSPERGTWEDWIGWALGALSNGHDTWMTEVEPEPTVDALYRREVLGAPATVGAETPETTDEVPELSGFRKVKPRP